MEITPSRPEYNVSFERGERVNIRRLIVTDIIVPSSRCMIALNKTQLLNARAEMLNRRQGYSDPYYTKTEFTLIMALFRKYREELEQKLEGDDLKMLIVGYQELLEHEEFLEKKAAEAKAAAGGDSSFELIHRPVEQES